jgi:hypothetical protein
MIVSSPVSVALTAYTSALPDFTENLPTGRECLPRSSGETPIRTGR